MKTVIKALLAASMLMPVAAQAQDQDGRQRGEGRRGQWGERAARPAPSADVGVQAQARAERPQFREQRPDRAPQPAQVQAQAQAQAQQRADYQRGDGQRGDGQRGDWRGQRDQRTAVDAAQREQQFRAQRDDRQGYRDNANGGYGWRQQQQVAPQAQYRQPAYGQSRGDQYRGNQYRGDQYRGNDGRNWNDGRRADDRGGSWNRGWRNDGRYDWSRNRQLNRSAYRLPRYYAPSGWGYGYRRFSVGVSLSSILFSQNYWIDDPYAYRLPEAYGPYRWVRYYDDALLVDIRSGQVVDTVYDIFD